LRLKQATIRYINELECLGKKNTVELCVDRDRVSLNLLGDCLFCVIPLHPKAVILIYIQPWSYSSSERFQVFGTKMLVL